MKRLTFHFYTFQQHNVSNGVPAQLQKKCRKRETLLMTLAFFISWGPLGVVYCAPLLTIVGTETMNPNILPLLTVKFGCAIINPLVYAYENHEVRMVNYYYVCEDG